MYPSVYLSVYLFLARISFCLFFFPLFSSVCLCISPIYSVSPQNCTHTDSEWPISVSTFLVRTPCMSLSSVPLSLSTLSHIPSVAVSPWHSFSQFICPFLSLYISLPFPLPDLCVCIYFSLFILLPLTCLPCPSPLSSLFLPLSRHHHYHPTPVVYIV